MPESAEFAHRFVILISHERSGSHFLTDLLASTGQLRSVDEVCNFNAVDPDKSEASFFRFRRALQATNPDISLRPNPESMALLVNSYLAHLATLVPGEKKNVLLDIKYGHVHNFEIGWWPTERRPFLFTHLENIGVRIIHLHRRDSLAATVSGHIADRVRVWHRREGDAVRNDQPFKLPPLKMVQEALMLEREKENFARWLTGNRYFDLEYETIAEDADVRDRAMRQLCEFLGIIPPETFQSKYQKVTPPLRDVLENHDELAKVVRMFGDGKLRLD